MAAAWCLALQNVVTRSAKDIDAQVLLFYVGFIGTISWFFVNLFSGGFQNIASFSLNHYQGITLAIIFDLAYAFSVTLAYQSGNSGFISLIGYLVIFYGFIVDFIFFNKTFSSMEILAALVILAVTLSLSVQKLRHPRHERKKTQE